jgi:hypothetical protein
MRPDFEESRIVHLVEVQLLNADDLRALAAEISGAAAEWAAGMRVAAEEPNTDPGLGGVLLHIGDLTGAELHEDAATLLRVAALLDRREAQWRAKAPTVDDLMTPCLMNLPFAMEKRSGPNPYPLRDGKVMRTVAQILARHGLGIRDPWAR